MEANLSALERNLQAPVFDLGGSSKAGLQRFVNACETEVPLGVLVRVGEHPGVLHKIISLLFVSVYIRILSRQLSDKGVTVKGFYAVYPTVEQPVAIYSLGADAEQYTHKYVLPGFSSGLSGKLRLFIMKLARLHPSVAGVVVLGCKKR